MSLQVTTCVEKNQRNLSSGEPWELKKATGYDANLQRENLARSHAQTWAAAKLEWHFYNAYFDGTGGRCLCRHKIFERCDLRNDVTSEFAIVGNCCVKKFLGHLSDEVATDAVFASLKRVAKDSNKALHVDLVQLARERNVITDFAVKWYADFARERKLTHQQLLYREQLNNKILSRNGCSVNIHCMPVVGPWQLDEAALADALVAGKVTKWEREFYACNSGKRAVSAKQAPIKRRIEENVLQAPWVLDRDELHEAEATGRIPKWAVEFYTAHMHQPHFSQAQSVAKWRIEDAVHGVASEL